MKRRPPRSSEAPYAKRARSSTGAMIPRAPTYRRKQSAAVQRALGVELKYFDAVKTQTALSTSWAGGELDPAANCLGVPTQGSGATNRDGTRIIVKSLQVQGVISRSITQDSTDSRNPSVVQLALVMDTQANGGTINAEDVYADTDPEVPGVRVLANSSRYKVLKTECFNMNDTSAISDGASTGSIAGNSHHFKWFIKMNQVMNLSGAAGTVADLKDIAFHMIGCTELNVSYENVAYNFRMRFIG